MHGPSPYVGQRPLPAITKGEATKLHAERRARERYGRVPDHVQIEIRRNLRRALKMKHGQFESRAAKQFKIGVVIEYVAPNGRVRASVTVEGRVYRVVYEQAANRIVTFLPDHHEGGAQG